MDGWRHGRAHTPASSKYPPPNAETAPPPGTSDRDHRMGLLGMSAVMDSSGLASPILCCFAGVVRPPRLAARVSLPTSWWRVDDAGGGRCLVQEYGRFSR